MSTGIITLIIIALIFLYIVSTILFIKWSTINVINGAVKTGKSTLAVWGTVIIHYLTKIEIYISNAIRFVINYTLLIWRIPFKKLRTKLKLKYEEQPLLYSNIPIDVKCGYVPLTKEILTRKEKPVEKSTVYIGEFSLIANSMDFKDMLLNEEILLFFKLAGHEFNGKIFIDTQNIEDCHYNLKRSINRYIYIHHTIKWIPFVVIMKCREMYYNSENNTAVNVFNESIEETMKNVIIPKFIWKKFDYRCYSIFTDDLPVNRNVIKFDKKTRKKGYLKAKKIVSFRNFLSLPEKFIEKEQIKNETTIKNKDTK